MTGAEQEVQGISACIDGLLGESRKGVIHNEAVGDMSLVAGRIGKRGMGLQHMAEHRLFQGFSLEEIGRIIAYALKAVESVESPSKHGTRLIFDRFGVRAVAATNPKMGNPIITGFILDTNNEKGAVDSDAAFLANHFYALDELSRIQEVGAAVKDGIAHLEDVVKNYPHNWEQIISAEVEMLKIKQNAKHNGTFMQAPNGEPTKLTERQWLQVRTQAFKDWFGDWENDPENASKVVDENGEPQVVYHGTWADFSVFKRGLLGEGDVSPGRTYVGHWFSDNKIRGVKKHMALFLNIREPREFFTLDGFDSQVEGEYYGKARSTLKKLGSRFARNMRENCFDGVIVEYDDELDGRSYVVLDSAQAKSATDNRGTFDGGNPDITFSVSPTLQEDLAAASENKVKAKTIIPLCSCPPVLVALGQRQRSVVTMAHVIRKIATKHGMKSAEIERALALLQDPEFVIRDSENSFIFIPGLLAARKDGEMGDVEVPIKLEHTANGDHYMLSMYPLDSIQKLSSQLRLGNLVYSKRNKKALGSTNGAPGLSPDLVRLVVAQGFTDNTITAEDIVKRGGEGFSASVTSQAEGENSFSMLSMTARAKVMMQPRGDEVEAEDIAKRWGWWLGQLERVNAAKGDKKLGSGVARYGTLITLLEATRGVLPPALAGMGRLNKLMEWAAVYAEMVETGEIPARKGVLLKGAIVEKFVAKLQQKRDETLRLGMSEEEAREVIAELGAEKLEQALAKVAKECRARLDMLLKERAYERIMTAAQRAYPKKERGKKSPRGKMDSRHYREMQTMLNWMERDANDVAQRTKAIRAELDALDENAEDYTERRDSLEHELKVVTTYGNRKGMGVMQAVNASLDFVRFVTESRHAWDRKAEDEKARLEWYRLQISRNFKKGNNAEERRKAKQEDSAPKVSLKGLKGSGYGTMSFIQLIYSAKHVWGEAFRRKICGEVADATAGMTKRRNLANNAVYQAFRSATGKKGEREFLSWFNEFNKLSDSGLKLRNTRRYTIEMDRQEARQWVSMSKDERQARRREVSAEEEMEKMVKHKLPPEEAIPKLIRILDEMDARDKARWEKRKDKEKPMKVASKVKFSEFYDKGDYMLRISKNAAANALLLLQQEDYKHLIENEGFVPIDEKGYIIDRSKDPDTPIDVEKTLKPLRDFIGEEGVAFAYALQRYVLLNGKDMQRVYEERMGVPLAMKDDYWRGNFDLATLKETDDLTQLNGGGLDGGGAYGFLIDRVRHYSHLDWNNTLTQVFNITVETQNNYVLMSGISYELRRLLADKNFAEGLQVELGVDYMNALKKWINLIEGAQKAPGFMSRWLQRVFQNSKAAMALAALSGNVSVLVKQWSAIIHGMLRTDVVSGVKVSEAGVREFAYKNIGMADYVASFARTLARQNVPLLEDILNSEWWQAREVDKTKFVADALLRPSGKKWSQAGKLARVGMDVIEWNDRTANLVSMVATVDCVYRHYAKVSKANNLNMSEREMRRLAVEEVGRTLAAVAQPKETIAKSLWGGAGRGNTGGSAGV